MSSYPRQEVIRELRREIVSGSVAAGQRLPTEHALAERFRVSRGTIRSALSELASIGVVEQRHGIGCFAAGSVRPTVTGSWIAFLHPPFAGLSEKIIFGMESRCAELGCELCVRQLSREREEMADTLAQLRNANCAGLIFSPFVVPDYYNVNSRILDMFENCGFRYVVVDTPIACHGVIRGDFVGNDGYAAMREAVKALVVRGHRRIGSIRVFAGVYTADQRFRGVFDQLAAEELPMSPELHRVIEDLPLPEQGRARIRELMALPEPPTAVLCTHDAIALNALDELRKMGKRVPEEVSIFGFDDNYFAEPLQLATVRQPLSEIGRRAVEVLLDGGTIRRQEFLPCELILRHSVSKRQESVL